MIAQDLPIGSNARLSTGFEAETALKVLFPKNELIDMEHRLVGQIQAVRQGGDDHGTRTRPPFTSANGADGQNPDVCLRSERCGRAGCAHVALDRFEQTKLNGDKFANLELPCRIFVNDSQELSFFRSQRHNQASVGLELLK